MVGVLLFCVLFLDCRGHVKKLTFRKIHVRDRGNGHAAGSLDSRYKKLDSESPSISSPAEELDL